MEEERIAKAKKKDWWARIESLFVKVCAMHILFLHLLRKATNSKRGVACGFEEENSINTLLNFFWANMESVHHSIDWLILCLSA
jgi:hypothetical protein